MKTIEGLCGIKSTVVCDSVSEAGVRLTTMLVDYPRIVHAEQLKHRMFSTSAASSRAIPFAKMAEQLTGMPVSFGKNQSGMQAGEEHSQKIQGRQTQFADRDGPACWQELSPEEAWQEASKDTLFWSEAFAEAGYHKQCYNRLTEPFQMMRVLITATEWDNFFWLRNDNAADPTLHEAARVMKEAYDGSTPNLLKAGEWHLPFIDPYKSKGPNGDMWIYEVEGKCASLEEAIKVSCARCAAQSFRNTDYGLEKSLQVYDRLVNGDKIHAGALEHVATPMIPMLYMNETVNLNTTPWSWQEGVSHADSNGNLWSGNFKGFVQYRKLIKGENYDSKTL